MKKEDIELITNNLKEKLEYYIEDTSDDEFDEVIDLDENGDELNKKHINIQNKKDLDDKKREIYELLCKEKRFELAKFLLSQIK